MWVWDDGLEVWGAMTGLAVLLLLLLAVLAWCAHRAAAAVEDDADLAAELQGRG
jgi:hypothetical protein